VPSRPHLPILGAFLGLGALAGWALVPAQVGPARAAEDPRLVVRLAGEPFPADADNARAAARRWLDEGITIAVAGVPEGRETRTRAELGARVDFERLAALARAAADPTSALRRAHDTRARGAVLDVPVPAIVDRQRAMEVALAVKDEVDVAPLDARWDVAAVAPRASRPGRRIDAGAALARIEEALVRGDRSVTLAADVVEPARTEASLAGVAAGAVLGRYALALEPDGRGREGGDREAARAARVAVLAARVDGLVVAPGETLDVGAAALQPRESPSAASARVGTAVHAAALLAGLTIAERHALPSLRAPSEAGLDAVLAPPARTLRVANPLEASVVLTACVAGGTLRVEVRGKEPTRAVTLEHTLESVAPFPERVVTDVRLPRGARILSQRGVPAIALTRTRAVRAGASVVRDSWRDAYAATPQIWRLGAGAPPAPGAAPPRRDPPPPALAIDLVVARAGVE